MEEELKEQVQELNNSTITLQNFYKRISMLLKDCFIYAIVYLFFNISFIYIKKNSLTILITYILIVCFFFIVLFFYDKMIFKYKNRYKKSFYYGYEIWCLLSDKLDWGNIRRKSLYKENIKEKNEALTAMNDFYYEFQKKLSPIATHKNLFKVIILIYHTLYIIGTYLFIKNILSTNI